MAKDPNEISTDTRADRAEMALRTYIESKGEVFEENTDEVGDLIADLLHLAERYDGPQVDHFQWLMDRAKGHYDTERIDQILADGEEDGSTITEP